MTNVVGVMGRMGLFGMALVLCLASAAKSSYAPIHGRAEVTPRELYSAAVRVFNDRGYVVANSDEAAGTVATEWVQVDDFSGTRMLHRWRAVVTDDDLALHIDCRVTDATLGPRPCENNKRADKFSGNATALHTAILEEAMRQHR